MCKIENTKKPWSFINSLTDNKFSNITEISANDSKIVDPTLIAECFNDYFVNIGPKLASEVSDESVDQETHNCTNIRSTLDTSFIFQYISTDNVKLSLMNPKTNKSPGLDKIPAKVLKLSADTISPSL